MKLFYIFLVLLFVGLGTYLGYRYFHDTILIKKTKFIENDEFKKNTGSGHANVILFYTNWCPHCKDTIKTWDSLNTIEFDPNLKLNYLKIDCEKEKELATDYDIKEYPTIILEKDGKKIVFDANLTNESFAKFIQAVSSM